MNLEEYRQKRQFAKSPEPAGEVSDSSVAGSRFVIQKHNASRLHYDLRLEIDGTLKSWAIPKGPSLDPKDKRLAIRTEDHPIEYLQFEGVIPKGEYGAGEMIVWDEGTWEPVNEGGFEDGDFKFRLNGSKVGGGWMLVHTGRKRGDKKHWLFFKERDEFARTREHYDVLEQMPASVVSNLTIEQLADESRQLLTAPSPKANSVDPTDIQGAAPSPFLQSPIQPALPTAKRTVPAGAKWVHEIKYDGYRMICHVRDNQATFISRNGKDWTDKLQFVAAQIRAMDFGTVVLDGEIAAVDENGVTNFQSLQNTIGRGDDEQLKYFVFDLLHLNGFDTSQATFLDRKEALRQLIPAEHPVVSYSEHLDGDGSVIFEQACRLGAEGIVSKRTDRRYPNGRTEDWIKIKSLKTDDFVVGGYTKSTAGRDFASLVLGRYDADGELHYQGRVGTGFTAATIKDISKILMPQEIGSSPFVNLTSKEAGREFRWVEPTMVVVVEYAGWTNDRQLRFPSFQGQRLDVETNDVLADANPALRDDSAQSSDAGAPDSKDSQSPQELEIPSESLAALANVRFTNSERIMYPEQQISKLEVAEYMAKVAGWMLPHVVDRPLALVRCPKGCQEKCFFQKKPPTGMPSCVESVEVTNAEGKSQHAAVIRDIEGLLTLTQFSALEIHTWGCRDDLPQRPDIIVFDLDPDESLPFERIGSAALDLKTELEKGDIQSFVKTSGGKGLHVVVPIRRRTSWEDVTRFCDAVVASLINQSPKSFTNRHAKPARKGKIYIDVLRNRFGATAIAPYSTRARNGGSVAMPIDWEEVPHLQAANQFTIRNADQRVLKSDPWEHFFECNQSLTKKTIALWC